MSFIETPLRASCSSNQAALAEMRAAVAGSSGFQETFSKPV